MQPYAPIRRTAACTLVEVGSKGTRCSSRGYWFTGGWIAGIIPSRTNNDAARSARVLRETCRATSATPRRGLCCGVPGGVRRRNLAAGGGLFGTAIYLRCPRQTSGELRNRVRRDIASGGHRPLRRARSQHRALRAISSRCASGWSYACPLRGRQHIEGFGRDGDLRGPALSNDDWVRLWGTSRGGRSGEHIE